MTTSSEMQAAVDRAVTNLNKINQFVNGDATTDVATDAGALPSLAKIVATGYDFLYLKPKTVAQIGAAGVAGRFAFVTNSNSATPGATLAAGGTNKVLVKDDGSTWTIVG